MVSKPSRRPGMIEQIPDDGEAGWTRRERESSTASPPSDGRPQGRRQYQASERGEKMRKRKTAKLHGKGTAAAGARFARATRLKAVCHWRARRHMAQVCMQPILERTSRRRLCACRKLCRVGGRLKCTTVPHAPGGRIIMRTKLSRCTCAGAVMLHLWFQRWLRFGQRDFCQKRDSLDPHLSASSVYDHALGSKGMSRRGGTADHISTHTGLHPTHSTPEEELS